MNINVIIKWSSGSVYDLCKKYDLYTCGDCVAYAEMLDFVRDNEPTTKTLYMVAKDINDHSDNNTIENIMFLLSKYAVNRFYEIED